MTDREIAYFGPRVMRHDLGPRGEELAIHEVYFDEEGCAVSYKVDALSPWCRAGSLSGAAEEESPGRRTSGEGKSP